MCVCGGEGVCVCGGGRVCVCVGGGGCVCVWGGGGNAGFIYNIDTYIHLQLTYIK